MLTAPAQYGSLLLLCRMLAKGKAKDKIRAAEMHDLLDQVQGIPDFLEDMARPAEPRRDEGTVGRAVYDPDSGKVRCWLGAGLINLPQ